MFNILKGLINIPSRHDSAAALIVCLVIAMPATASATILTFDSQPEVYFVSPISEGGFTFTETADGFGTNNYLLWPSNGTVHLMSWTNSQDVSGVSGFTLTKDDNTTFSLSSFLFGSGYIGGGNPVSSLTVTGTGGLGFSQTFTSGVDYFDFGPGLTLLTLTGAGSTPHTIYTFTAAGFQNRAQFDDFAVNEAQVPEPATLALLGLGLAGLGFLRRRRT